MTQRSIHWDGASLGDADALAVSASDGIGYRLSNEDYVSPFHDIMCRALFNGTGNRGVLYNWLNELAVTGAATPVQVDTGAAIVYGLFYRNTAAVNVAVGTPTNDTRYDYVVIRRDWAAQTARITLVAGIEGGGVPALTQSASPTGTGFYDIPLAILEVDTLGNITVTDAREFVTFTTAAVTNSVATGTIVNDAVEWEQREQVAKNLIFGGGELLSFVSAFSYSEGVGFLGAAVPTWGAAAATMEGWQVTGTGTGNYMLFHIAFKVPADYVPGSPIGVRLWWIDDWAGDSNFDIASGYQLYRDSEEVTFGSYVNTDAIVTSVVDTVHISQLGYITDLQGDEMVLYAVRYYNSAGAEAVLFTALEITYTAYV